jgi:hypothetical protein
MFNIVVSLCKAEIDVDVFTVEIAKVSESSQERVFKSVKRKQAWGRATQSVQYARREQQAARKPLNYRHV